MVDNIHYIGRFLIILGIVISAIGGILLLSGNIPCLGRLPGDIIVRRKNFTLYFPLATSILLSVILTFILWFINRR